MSKILLVEDDVTMAIVVQDWLQKLGNVIEVASNGEDGLYRLTNYHYDLAVLDWQLPALSGLQICTRYRNSGGQTPILMLTSKSATIDKTTGLDSGADDYLTKPFEKTELISRIKALLRRPAVINQSTIRLAGIELNAASKSVSVNGETIEALVPKEISILELLMRHPNETFTVQAIMDRLWSSESERTPETVRPYITRLRSKLGPAGEAIKTVHGCGYKFEEPN